MTPQPAVQRARTGAPVVPTSTSPQTIATRVRGEFNEMPGLCLTFKQAQRLWALDGTTCAIVLEKLLTEGFLRRTGAGVYIRSDRQQTVAA